MSALHIKGSSEDTSALQNRDLIREMGDLLRQSGIDLSARQLDLLWSYHTLLRRHNPQLNLTRIYSFKNMVFKLYVDSILPAGLMDLPSPLLDLGTGSGMPGIPLKIAYPQLEIILCESRQKRVAFLEMVIQELGLKNISVVGKMITPKFQTPVAGVITRAVERIEKTLERIQGCLNTGGVAVFMKGPRCDMEIETATKRLKGRFELVQNRSYQIPRTPHRRRLVVFQRIDRPFIEVKTKAMEKHPFHKIESEQNSVFKDLKKLLTSRGIKRQCMTLISGEKMVNEALNFLPRRCTAWITGSDQTVPPGAAPEGIPWYLLSPHLFRELDVFGTGGPLLRLKFEPMPSWHPQEGFTQGLSLLIPFQDPENVGAAIRSGVAFGAEKIILLEECAHPYLPKAVRSSGGAVFHAPLYSGPSIKNLPANLPIVALSPEGRDISKNNFPPAFGLLPGLEGSGLPGELRKNAFSIPIRKEVESLNAAAATAIALYLWSQESKTSS